LNFVSFFTSIENLIYKLKYFSPQLKHLEGLSNHSYINLVLKNLSKRKLKYELKDYLFKKGVTFPKGEEKKPLNSLFKISLRKY